MPNPPPSVIELPGKDLYFVGYMDPNLPNKIVKANLVYCIQPNMASLLRRADGTVLPLEVLIEQSLPAGNTLWSQEKRSKALCGFIIDAIVKAKRAMFGPTGPVAEDHAIPMNGFQGPAAFAPAPATLSSVEHAQQRKYELARGNIKNLIVMFDKNKPDGEATLDVLLMMYEPELVLETGIKSKRDFTTSLLLRAAELYNIEVPEPPILRKALIEHGRNQEEATLVDTRVWKQWANTTQLASGPMVD